MNIISIENLPSEVIQTLFNSADAILNGKQFTFHFNSLLLSDSSPTSYQNSKILEEAVKALGGSCKYSTEPYLDKSFDIVLSTLSDENVLRQFVSLNIPLLKVSTANENTIRALIDLYAIRRFLDTSSRIAVTGELSSDIANSFLVLAAKLGIELALILKGKPPFEKYLSIARNYSIVTLHSSLEAASSGFVYSISEENNSDLTGAIKVLYSSKYNKQNQIKEEEVAIAMAMLLYSLNKLD
ncbi:MAG: hypothetical protein QXY10_00585 [Candidatus Micrarchaeaceae archaeon]